VQFIGNECILKSVQGKMVAMAFCKHNLYQMTFIKVHGMDAAHWVQSSTKQEVLELWDHPLGHLNVKNVYAFESIVSDMNFGEMTCLTSFFVHMELVKKNIIIGSILKYYIK